MARGHGRLSSSIFLNASHNSADLTDSLKHLIEKDTTKITDVNTNVSYDPDVINDQSQIL